MRRMKPLAMALTVLLRRVLPRAWLARLEEGAGPPMRGRATWSVAIGALSHVASDLVTHGKNFEGSITLLGERGTVRVGGVAVNKIEHWEFDAPHEDDAKVADASYGVRVFSATSFWSSTQIAGHSRTRSTWLA